jgi:hypothetical protein
LALAAIGPILASTPSLEGRVPEERAAIILYKALQYDGRLVERARGRIRLIVFAADPGVTARANALAGFLRDAGRIAHERNAAAPAVDAVVASAELSTLAERTRDVHAVLLVSDREPLPAFLPALMQASLEGQFPILADDPSLIASCATLALGLTPNDEKTRPRITVHLERARSQGCRFDAKFLQLCEVVGR